MENMSKKIVALIICLSMIFAMNFTAFAAEGEIIKLVRNIGFGKIVVTVKNGKPVFVETQKTIQLTGNK